MIRLILLITFSIFMGSAAFGELENPLCVNDKEGKQTLTGQDINISIDSASDPLSAAFKKYRSKEAKLCADLESTPMFSKVLKAIEQFTPEISVNPPTFIKKACIEASLQRQITRPAFVCDQESSAADKVKRQCLNQNSVDYIHYAINSALKCFATITSPIDARTIFKKINNESGFNFFLSYDGGTGMGQLTKWPALEIGHLGKGNGNARKILEDLAASEDPTCAPFKEVARKDLDSPPGVPVSAKRNVCDWISTNEGVTRNLIYSLGYYVYNRERIKATLREEHAEPLVLHREFVNTLTLFSYGPNGGNNLDTFIFRSQMGRNSNPNQLLKSLRNFDSTRDKYLNQTEDTMKEALKFFNGKDVSTPEELRGDTCVEK